MFSRSLSAMLPHFPQISGSTREEFRLGRTWRRWGCFLWGSSGPALAFLLPQKCFPNHSAFCSLTPMSSDRCTLMLWGKGALHRFLLYPHKLQLVPTPVQGGLPQFHSCMETVVCLAHTPKSSQLLCLSSVIILIYSTWLNVS